MTLQSSGAISAKDINVEFRRWGTNNPAYEGRLRISTDGAPLIGMTAGGKTSLSDFYGKSFAKPITGSGGSTTIKNGYKHHAFTGNGVHITALAAGDNSL